MRLLPLWLDGPVKIDEAFVGEKEQNRQKEQITPAGWGTHLTNNRDTPAKQGTCKLLVRDTPPEAGTKRITPACWGYISYQQRHTSASRGRERNYPSRLGIVQVTRSGTPPIAQIGST